jgi:predicted Fe-S protein YdhL (DUF1289 family)
MQPPRSPCINVCVLDEADICRGCFRSRAEIALWSTLSPPGQWRVVEAAQRRRAQAQSRGESPGENSKDS